MIICPNKKNPEVAREFNELVQATSEQAAYHIWSLNNGNAIDKAPNGAESKLFLTLLEHYNGDRTKAIQAKAKTYGRSFLLWFGNWTEQRNTRPLVKFYGPTMGKTTAAKSNPRIVDFDAIVREDVKKLADEKGISVRELLMQNPPELVLLLKAKVEEWRSDDSNIGKVLVVSKSALAKEDIFDNRVSIPSRDEFVRRQVERSKEDRPKEELIKEAEDYYDDLMSKWYDNPVIENNYVSDLEQDVSKVVDENGEPLVVWHGSKSNFSVFNTKRLEHTEKIYPDEDSIKKEALKLFTDEEIKIIENIDADPFASISDPFAPPSLNDILYNKFLSEKKRIRESGIKEVLHYNIGSFFTSDKNYADSYGNVKYPVFLNIKNPNFSDRIHSLYTTETRVNELKNDGRDGIYGHDVKGRDVESMGIEYVVFTPNQIKSIDNEGPTPYEGTFSRENDDIYHHIQGKLIKTVQDVKDVLSDILELYYDFHNWLGTRVTKNKRNIKSYNDQILIVLNEFDLPSKTMYVNSGGFLQFNDKLIQENLYKFSDKIDQHRKLRGFVRITKLFSSLQNKFPNIKEKIMLGKLSDANAKFENGHVYIDPQNVTPDTLIEECLHPFVEAIYAENRALFNNLLKQARKEFPKLRAEIAVTYKDDKFTPEDRYKELVTLALSRHYADIYVNGKSEEKSIWKQALEWLLEKLGIGINQLNPKTTLGELADALYEAEYVNVDRKYYFNSNQQLTNLQVKDELKSLGRELINKCKE